MSQAAPPVSLHGDIDRRWLIGTRLAASLAVLGTCGWWWMLWQHQGAAGWSWQVAVPAATLLGAIPIWSLAVTPPWTLQWDGAQWTWGSPSQAPSPATVRVTIDLGRWLLLRVDTNTARHWLALSHAHHRPVWHGLRCALYCPRPAEAAHAEPTDGAPDRAA